MSDWTTGLEVLSTHRFSSTHRASIVGDARLLVIPVDLLDRALDPVVTLVVSGADFAPDTTIGDWSIREATVRCWDGSMPDLHVHAPQVLAALDVCLRLIGTAALCPCDIDPVRVPDSPRTE